MRTASHIQSSQESIVHSQIKILVIAGTLAPQISEHIYYEKLITHLKQSGLPVEFCTIPRLGIGGVEASVEGIAAKYCSDSNCQYVFIGHSQGGIVASLLAMLYPTQTLTVICIASPFCGTVWTDPVSIPVRTLVETVSALTSGGIRLHPRLPRVSLPIDTIPIVRDLSRRSGVLQKLTTHLSDEQTEAGYVTHSIIGLHDIVVLPKRSAHFSGKNIVRYLVIPEILHQKLAHRLPRDIEPVYSRAGHVSIVVNDTVIELVCSIVRKTIT